MPIDLGITIGEYALHLRASLDNMICALVETHGMSVTSSTAFVIADTAAGWTHNTHRLTGLSAEELVLIDALQPYHRHNRLFLLEVGAGQSAADEQHA
ncbi:MAG: hypothetical protein ACR2LF_00085 [Jatrophihabitantaceae bacterium]